MDIYFRKSGERELRKVNIDKQTKIKTETGFFTYNDFLNIPNILRRTLLDMKDDEILVFDNLENKFPDGIYKDNYHNVYTKILTDYPRVFVPENPDFRPGEKEARQKFEQFISSSVSNYYIEKRAEASLSGIAFEPSEEELAHIENTIRTQYAKSFHESLSRLKSYNEMGTISPPTMVRQIQSSEFPSLSNDKEPERVKINTSSDIYRLAKKFGHRELIDESVMVFRNTATEQLEKKRVRLGIPSLGLFRGIIGEDNDLLSNQNLSLHKNAIPLFLSSDNGRAVYESEGVFVFEDLKHRDARLPAVQESAAPATQPQEPAYLAPVTPIRSLLSENEHKESERPRNGFWARFTV